MGNDTDYAEARNLLSAHPDGWWRYTALASTVLAVVVRRVDGWCVYVGGVPGMCHDREVQRVREHGDKVTPEVAKAIIATYFHPGFDPEGLPYAH